MRVSAAELGTEASILTHPSFSVLAPAACFHLLPLTLRRQNSTGRPNFAGCVFASAREKTGTKRIVYTINNFSLIVLTYHPRNTYNLMDELDKGGTKIMSKLVEIRWHGRGGQGAKTASLLLADAAFNTGKYIQGFPEYGPERMGAPITAYNRISDDRLSIHCNIYAPDYVVVVDDTLLESVDVTAGLKESGAIIVNTDKQPDEIKSRLKGYKGKVCTIDARTISIDTLGKYFPNTPMLGAVVKVSGIMDEQTFLDDMVESFKHKFAKKPEVVEGNIKSLERAMKEVQGL